MGKCYVCENDQGEKCLLCEKLVCLECKLAHRNIHSPKEWRRIEFENMMFTDTTDRCTLFSRAQHRMKKRGK